ncbi:hypothetical protein BJY04DRAFT_221635 [Aspergillus karnatakaensis]|uniref:HNH endonuclease signature motif containing protein n=1 Tax=Aspergillus karnatakaensis TaxID=1810916 RepID=UPI003CCCA9EB
MPHPWVIPEIPRPRNAHVFGGSGQYLGGGFFNDPPAHVTNREFYEMCTHFVHFPQNHRFNLYHLGENNSFQAMLPRNSQQTPRGRYVVLGVQRQVIPVKVTSEQVVRRARTPQQSTRSQRANQRSFAQRVWNRDGRCVLTGLRGPVRNPRRLLAAAHIFPVGQLGTWTRNGYQAWITDNTNPNLIAPRGLFSAQNGLMLEQNAHTVFDDFTLGFNPNNGYRVVVFEDDVLNFGGGELNQSTRTGPMNARVSNDCLNWHYRQCILTNMRGAGEPIWNVDEEDHDDMQALMEHEHAAELLEDEFGTRLGPFIEVS